MWCLMGAFVLYKGVGRTLIPAKAHIRHRLWPVNWQFIDKLSAAVPKIFSEGPANDQIQSRRQNQRTKNAQPQIARSTEPWPEVSTLF